MNSNYVVQNIDFQNTSNNIKIYLPNQTFTYFIAR